MNSYTKFSCYFEVLSSLKHSVNDHQIVAQYFQGNCEETSSRAVRVSVEPFMLVSCSVHFFFFFCAKFVIIQANLTSFAWVLNHLLLKIIFIITFITSHVYLKDVMGQKKYMTIPLNHTLQNLLNLPIYKLVKEKKICRLA